MPRLRTRDPDQQAARQYIGGAIPRVLKSKLQLAAGFNGRSLAAETQSRLERSFEADPVEGCPVELDSFAELLVRTMIEVGETITKTSHTTGRGVARNWIADGYAWNQAVSAAMHVLELSRADEIPLQAVFTSPDDPEYATQDLGKRIADDILAMMRDMPEPEFDRTLPACGWTCRVRQTLGNIGEWLDRHSAPDPDEADKARVARPRRRRPKQP